MLASPAAMMPDETQEGIFSFPRQAHPGRTFVYVLRCRGEDLLKVGFTRDPIGRFHTLHPSFYSFFDLDESLMIETDRLNEARRLERLFIERWPEHRAPAPLVINARAGGDTEWSRGVGATSAEMAERLGSRYGHTLHSPLRRWLREQLLERADRLFAWSERIYQIVEWQEQNQEVQIRDSACAIILCDALDALDAVGIPGEQFVAEAAHRWYVENHTLRWWQRG